MESTWETRDLVVLDAVCRYLDENYGKGLIPDGKDLAELTGLPMEAVERALVALNGEYVEVMMTFGGAEHWAVSKVRPAARRAVGQWPTPESMADRLVEAMAQASERVEDEEQRGLLKKAATWFAGAGRDVLVDVTAAVVTRGAGLG